MSSETKMTPVSLPGTPAGEGKESGPARHGVGALVNESSSTNKSFASVGLPDTASPATSQRIHKMRPQRLTVASSPKSKGQQPGVPFQHSAKVRMAVSRFKGESGKQEPGDSLATLVGAALERKKVMDRVRMGFEAVRETEEKHGIVLRGDENTHNIQMLKDRHQSTLSAGKEKRGCGVRYLSFRFRLGNFVTNVAVRYFILALIVLDMGLFILEINDAFPDQVDLFKLLGQIIVWIFVAEVAAKLIAFEKEFFSSWWNIFDFMIVLVSVIMMNAEKQLEAILVGRTVKLFGVAHRSLRVLRIVIKVYTHGTRVAQKATSGIQAYPIELVVEILRKVRFSHVLTRTERHKIPLLINSLIANTLYIPDMDGLTAQLERDSQVPDWIKSNFNSKPAPLRPTASFTEGHQLMRKRTRKLSFNQRENSVLRQVDADAVMEMLDETMDSWDFDVHQFTKATKGWPLFHLFSSMMQWHGLTVELDFDEKVSNNLVVSIEKQYHRNSYHNSIHGADVLQTVHALMVGCGVGSRLTPLQRMALLLAAAAHDVGHPGVSNSFLVATRAQEAILRNDTSVLEHMHAYRLFCTTRNSSCNVFASLSREDFASVRHHIIKCILSTDLGSHFEIIGQFKAHINAVSSGGQVPDFELEQMVMCLKMADISHPTKDWPLHSKWTQRCMAEFYLQGDMEARLGLPISPLMDRKTTNIPKAQIGFVKILVSPLVDVWADAYEKLPDWSIPPSNTSSPATPGTFSSRWLTGSSAVLSLDPAVLIGHIRDNIEHNIQRWERISAGDDSWNLEDRLKAKTPINRTVHPTAMGTSTFFDLSAVNAERPSSDAVMRAATLPPHLVADIEVEDSKEDEVSVPMT